MKIEGPRKSSGASGTSKSGGAKGGDDGSFSGLIDDGGADAGKPVAGGVSISRLDALLSMQETQGGASEEAKKRAKKRGLELLDMLDRVRLDMLAGGVPEGALRSLEHTLSMHREKLGDPMLEAVLDEIDLRVQVELAKADMSRRV